MQNNCNSCVFKDSLVSDKICKQEKCDNYINKNIKVIKKEATYNAEQALMRLLRCQLFEKIIEITQIRTI